MDPQLQQMFQQFQQALQDPKVVQRLQDPAQVQQIALHLANQLPAPPPEILQQMTANNPPAQQQPPPSNPPPTPGGLAGLMLPGGPQQTTAGQNLQLAGQGQKFKVKAPPDGGGQGPLDNAVLQQHFEALDKNKLVHHKVPEKDAGSTSSILTIGITDPRINNGQPTVIPSVWNGKVVSQDEAIKLAVQSGKHWPSFPFQQPGNKWPAAADKADENWHKYMQYMQGATYNPFTGLQ